MRDRRCARLRFGKAQQLNAVIAHLGFSGNFSAAALRHSRWLPSASQSRAKWRLNQASVSRRGVAQNVKRLIAQAVSLLQQDQPALIDIGDIDHDRAAGRSSAAGTASRNGSSNSLSVSDIGAFRRQRQHHAIELAAHKFLEQHLGLRFAQLQPQPRISRLQSRQHARQYVRSERRNDAES